MVSGTRGMCVHRGEVVVSVTRGMCVHRGMMGVRT